MIGTSSARPVQVFLPPPNPAWYANIWAAEDIFLSAEKSQLPGFCGAMQIRGGIMQIEAALPTLGDSIAFYSLSK